MSFIWDDNLALGVEEIDDQHKEIFVRFDKLSMACQEQHGSDVIQELMDYLHEYVAHHFAAEEAIMEQVNYPGLTLQREQHEMFRKDLDALSDESKAGMDLHKLSLAVDRRLVQWFVLHIRNLDSEMARFVKLQKS